MEDVLDLYAEPYDPNRPVVCFDETSTQLLADTRPPLPAQPGRPRRQDYEYRRGGTRNLFLACEPLAGWRYIAITERRTMQDFAHQMQWLVDVAYPHAPVVRVVLLADDLGFDQGDFVMCGGEVATGVEGMGDTRCGNGGSDGLGYLMPDGNGGWHYLSWNGHSPYVEDDPYEVELIDSNNFRATGNN